MKRIVIIEGNALSLHRFGETYEVRIDNDRAEVALPLTPEAAEQIGASFREPIRVVVEIGEADVVVGSLASATREELIHALAAARHTADEYRRENEALVNSKEMLRADITASRCPPFDPEKHITKATVCKWLEEDAALNAKAVESIDEDNYAAKNAYRTCADDTRAIIARINAHKDSP